MVSAIFLNYRIVGLISIDHNPTDFSDIFIAWCVITTSPETEQPQYVGVHGINLIFQRLARYMHQMTCTNFGNIEKGEISWKADEHF